MIYTFIAYAPRDFAMDLGRCYNAYMALLPSDDDWACFIDHDAMFTTRDWYGQLARIVERHPGAGCFTAMTNRVSNRAQVYGRQPADHDIARHRRIGARLRKRFDTAVVPLAGKQPMSGVVMLTRKAVWKKVGFSPGFLGVDWDYHRGCLRKGLRGVSDARRVRVSLVPRRRRRL